MCTFIIMDEFIALESPIPSEKAAVALDAFIAQYATCMSLLKSGVSEEKKSLFSNALMAALNYDSGDWKNWSMETTAKALQTVRIVSRETVACSAVFCEEGVRCLLKHAKLHKSQEAFEDNDHSLEAMKCIANLLLLAQEWKGTVIYKGGFNNLTAALEEELRIETLFIACRILFLLTINNRPIANQFLDTLNGGPILYRQFRRIYDDIQPEDFSTDQTAIDASKPISTQSKTMTIIEILKVIYNLSLRSAPELAAPGSPGGTLFRSTSRLSVLTMDDRASREESRVRQCDGMKEFIPDLIELFHHAPLNKQPLSSPHTHIINALMNFPLSDEGWRKNLYFKDGDYRLVSTLLEILDITITTTFPPSVKSVDDLSSRKQIGDVSVNEALSPLFALLFNIARFDTTARGMIRDKLMPEDLDRSKPLDEGSTLTNRLIQFLTCYAHENLKQLTSELSFMLCDENVNTFVAYFGYGTVAGYLFQRGIMSPTDPGSAAAKKIVELDPITGQIKKDDDDNPLSKMTDEEKEREAERLFVLFEQLNATGVIKATFPGSNYKSS